MSGPHVDPLTLSVEVKLTGSEYSSPMLAWRVDGTASETSWPSSVRESWGVFAGNPEVASEKLPEVVRDLDIAFGFDSEKDAHPSSTSLSSLVVGYLGEARRNGRDLQVRFRTDPGSPLLTELPYGCLTVDVGGRRQRLALVEGLSVERSPQGGKTRHTRQFHHSRPRIAVISDPAESTGSWAADLHSVLDVARTVGDLQSNRPMPLEDLEPETDVVVVWSHGDLDSLELGGGKIPRTELGSRLLASDPLIVLLAACKSAYAANHLVNIGVPMVVANATTSQTLIQQAVLSSLLKDISRGAMHGLSSYEVSVCLKNAVLNIFAAHNEASFWGLAEPSVWVADEESSYLGAAKVAPVLDMGGSIASSPTTDHQTRENASIADEGGASVSGQSAVQRRTSPLENGSSHRNSVALQVDGGSVVWIAANESRVESGPDDRRRSKPFRGPVDALCISTSGELVAAQVKDQLFLAAVDRDGGLAWSKVVVDIPTDYRIAAMDARGHHRVAVFTSPTGAASATFYSSGDLSNWEAQSERYASVAIDGTNTYAISHEGQLMVPSAPPVEASWIAVDAARSGSSLLVALLGRRNGGQVVLLQRLHEDRTSVRSFVPDEQLIDLSIVRSAPGSGGPELVAGYSATDEWLVWGWDQAEELS